MKKIAKLLLVSIFALAVVAGAQGHVHDDECGYNPETGKGCIFEIETYENKEYGD